MSGNTTTAHACRDIVEELLRIVRLHSSSAKQGPVWASEAKREWEATQNLPGAHGAVWGPEPWRDTLNAVFILIDSAIANVQSVIDVLHSDHCSSVSVDTLTRGALEAAAQASWILDPSITGKTRVSRFHTLSRRSADRLLESCIRMGITQNAQLVSHLTQRNQYVSNFLGLREDISARGNWKSYEGQEEGHYGERVATFLRSVRQPHERGPYAYLCGSSHAELWRLELGYGISGSAIDTTSIVENPDRLRLALAMSVESIWQPSAILYKWFGKQLSRNELDLLVPRIFAAFRQ